MVACILVDIGSDNGSYWIQAIVWTNDLLTTGPLGTNLGKILIKME